LLSVFPRIFILAPYEAGIRITLGRRIRRKQAGWYVIWPLVQRFVWMEIQTQIVDLRSQSVRTKDGYSTVVSGAVQYSIKDIEKAIVNIQDIDKAIETLCLGVILEFVRDKTLVECQDVQALKKEILDGLKDASKGWGLKIEKIFITDLDKARNIRVLTNKNETLYLDS